MDGAFYIGAVGLDAQQQALDVVANNVANINTTAFKRQVVQFGSLVNAARNVGDDASVTPNSAFTGAGVTVAATPHVWAQGTLSQTAQPLDIAIQGDGFLEVLGQNGSNLLWRGGSMTVNADGYLATPDGTALRVMIQIPQSAQNLSIASNGVVSGQINGATRQLGVLSLALVKDPSQLLDTGNGYFEMPDAAGTTVVTPGEGGSGTLVQGSLETSNVDLSDEMVNMVLVQRAYGAAAQVVQAGDQLMSIVNSLRR